MQCPSFRTMMTRDNKFRAINLVKLNISYNILKLNISIIDKPAVECICVAPGGMPSAGNIAGNIRINILFEFNKLCHISRAFQAFRLSQCVSRYLENLRQPDTVPSPLNNICFAWLSCAGLKFSENRVAIGIEEGRRGFPDPTKSYIGGAFQWGLCPQFRPRSRRPWTSFIV